MSSVPTASGAPSVSDNWYRETFGALYPIIYSHRNVDTAAPEAAFAVRQLALTACDSVLDLCCGGGRHMVHMSSAVGLLVGMDYSEELLKVARETVGRNSVLVRGDMRDIPLTSTFDAIVSFFTSFGYFGLHSENVRAVQEFSRVLQPGGRFLIDHLNSEHVVRTLSPESVRGSSGLRIHERRWIDGARVYKLTRVDRDGLLVGEWGESVQMYSQEDFFGLLASVGLVVDRVFGDFAANPLTAHSPRMIMVGQKRLL